MKLWINIWSHWLHRCKNQKCTLTANRGTFHLWGGLQKGLTGSQTLQESSKTPSKGESPWVLAVPTLLWSYSQDTHYWATSPKGRGSQTFGNHSFQKSLWRVFSSGTSGKACPKAAQCTVWESLPKRKWPSSCSQTWVAIHHFGSHWLTVWNIQTRGSHSPELCS